MNAAIATCRCFTVLVGFFEMPFCCTCMVCCAKLADKIKFMENYMARGIL